MHHINKKMEVGTCRAKVPENCRFYNGENDTRHYADKDEAIAAAARMLQEKYETHDIKKSKYSFTAEFQALVDEHDEKFDGVSNRFFNYDIRGKYLNSTMDLEARADDFDNDPSLTKFMAYNDMVYDRVLQSMTTPADGQVSDEVVVKRMEALGFTDITSRPGRKGRQWWAHLDGETVVVSSDSSLKNLHRYKFYVAPEGYDRLASVLTVRSLKGVENEQKLTGKTMYKQFLVGRRNKSAADERREMSATLLRQVAKLEAAQGEGKNFNSQMRYVKENSAKVATAWMDKKNTDEMHQHMAQTTSLLKHFRKAEFDNDTTALDVKEFEQTYEDTYRKLPKIDESKRPEIRVRKLGKHRASGVFFPDHNTVCVDVHDSGSFVHEMGHHYDMVLKKNASLQKDFAPIVAEYSRNIRLPEEHHGRKLDYYTTPTEIFARSFELYSNEKLGIDNRLVDSEYIHNEFDYKPFNDNPELKEKVFSFMEKLFENDMYDN